jgi:hypothetical protein
VNDPEPSPCPHCGAHVASDAKECPECGQRLPPRPAAGPSGPVRSAALQEFEGRVARLAQWAEAVRGLAAELPTLPRWAVETVREGGDPEPWMDALRGVERLAQRRVQAALEEWEKLARPRLARLEAYSVDSRLEREQMEEILRTVRAGEVARALALYHQVDRVLSLKERHLDQAREELERLVGMLRDIDALGLSLPDGPPEAVAASLEDELRAGHLAALKQTMRGLRQGILDRLKAEFPQYVTEYGNLLLAEKREGVPVDAEAAELARGAREFVDGHPEEALKRLRLLVQVHAPGPMRSPRRGAADGSGTDGAPTPESSRTA